MNEQTKSSTYSSYHEHKVATTAEQFDRSLDERGLEMCIIFEMSVPGGRRGGVKAVM